MWSTGVILFLLLGGYLPFDDEDEDLVFDNTRNGKYEFIPNFWSHVSSEAKDLVTRMLTVNPNKRISAMDALQHKWMRNTDKALDDHELNIIKLRDSVVKGQHKDQVVSVKQCSSSKFLDKLFPFVLTNTHTLLSLFL